MNPAGGGELRAFEGNAEVDTARDDLFRPVARGDTDQVYHPVTAAQQDRGRPRRVGGNAEHAREVVAAARRNDAEHAVGGRHRRGHRADGAIPADRHHGLALAGGVAGDRSGVAEAGAFLDADAGARRRERPEDGGQAADPPAAAGSGVHHEAVRITGHVVASSPASEIIPLRAPARQEPPCPRCPEPRRRGVPSDAMSGDDELAEAGLPQVGGRFLLVQTTTDSRAEAVELARAAVEARLAACAQVSGPVASTYWWEGSLERTEEWLLTLKLPASGYQALADFIARSHSYDEPEIVATPIVAGSEGFLSWIEEETLRS